MHIKDLKTQLPDASKPVIKALHKGNNSRVLAIGFREGMVLREHVAHWPSRLMVIEGSVVYNEGAFARTMSCYDEMEIPVGVPHSVSASSDALCLLMQG